MKNTGLFGISFAFLLAITTAQAAENSGQDILAKCENAVDHSTAFDIIGNLDAFLGLRMGARSAKVELANAAKEDIFGGEVTLVKGAPYSYTIYGEGKRMTSDAPKPVLYGWSAGTTLGIQETLSDNEVISYVCTLNSDLLIDP